jgi:hypothetical protein
MIPAARAGSMIPAQHGIDLAGIDDPSYNVASAGAWCFAVASFWARRTPKL